MQFEKASSGKLIFGMVRSMAMIAACIFTWMLTDSMVSRAFALVVLASSLSSLRNAYKLDDTPGPLFSMGPNGIVISPAMSAGKLIAWDDVVSIDCYTFRIYHVIPVYSYLIVRVRGRHYLNGFQLWAQFGWLRPAILIPSTYFEGGSGVAKLMKKRAAQVREGARHAQVGGFAGAQGIAPPPPIIAPIEPPVLADAGALAHVQAHQSPPVAVAEPAGDMDYDAVIARYLASKNAAPTPPPAPVRAAPAAATAATYVPPGSPNYVVRGNSEPLLNGKPFPRDDRPGGFGRKGLAR